MATELYEYLNIMNKGESLIVVITLAATLISGVVGCFIFEPTYKSDISVIIGKQDTGDAKTTFQNYNDVMMCQKLVKTYSGLVKSRTVLKMLFKSLVLISRQ